MDPLFLVALLRLEMKRAFIQLSQSLIRGSFIYSLREAFIALIPYLVILALSALIVESFRIFTFLDQGSPMYQWMLSAAITIQQLFPFVVVIAISYFTSVNTGINPLIGSLLAAACFVSGTGYFQISDAGILIKTQTSTIYMILVPASTTYLMAYFNKLSLFNIIKNRFISVFLVKHINLILPFAIIFFAFSSLFPAISGLIEQGTRALVPKIDPNHVSSDLLQWIVVGHGLWLLGISGSTMVDSMMVSSFNNYEILPGVNAEVFKNVFISYGGAGSVWGFVIAVFLMRKDEQLQQIAKISVPFQIFNISEVVTFGIPLILNPYFIIPFMLCPLINFLVSYLAIYAGLFQIGDTYVSWITPVVLSGYLITDGNIFAALLQVFLIITNAYIYMPFVRWYSLANSEQLNV